MHSQASIHRIGIANQKRSTGRAHGATSEETRISDSVLRTCHSMLCSLSNAPNVLTTKTVAGCRRQVVLFAENESLRTVPGDSLRTVPFDFPFDFDEKNKSTRTVPAGFLTSMEKDW